MKGLINIVPSKHPDLFSVFQEINKAGDSKLLGHVLRLNTGWASIKNIGSHRLRRDAIDALK